ncbi:hypothetical protein [Clavibacter sp.]|uniref:hypothetical protein n=1 Tax=Clavibacter sp. TaxID=1871044 RepID=UPI0019AD3E9B|nr:hypothetical protein [Clavibacter sp.]MBD5381951.1 hypothetical protein [Clavibacter sp.]
MVKIENNQIFSTEGKIIHRIGTDTYFKRGTAIISDSVANYEEVDEIPPYTKESYDKKVDELVRSRYSESEEFAIQRKAINAAFSPSTASAESALSEYQAYNEFVEDCKQKAKNPELYKGIEE